MAKWQKFVSCFLKFDFNITWKFKKIQEFKVRYHCDLFVIFSSGTVFDFTSFDYNKISLKKNNEKFLGNSWKICSIIKKMIHDLFLKFVYFIIFIFKKFYNFVLKKTLFWISNYAQKKINSSVVFEYFLLLNTIK